jgi:phage terminase small subunit
MGHGGARYNAGRKPKASGTPTKALVAATVVSIDSGRGDDIVTKTPPKDLPADQHDFWRRCAGRAIEAGTLTPQTVEAFRLLCELEAEKRATRETIEKDGRTTMGITTDVTSSEQHVQIKAHPLTSSYRQLAQRVEALMARFSLAPFGKPVAGGKPKTQGASPWARIAAAKNGRA